MATRTFVDLKPTSTVENIISKTSTIEDKKPLINNISTIRLGAIATLVGLAVSPTIIDLSPSGQNIQTSDYAKITAINDILPFRLSITNIGIEGYDPQNPPGIGVQIIGFSNYIL